MCTQKQIRCIYAVSKQLGQKFDDTRLRTMTIDDASIVIDELKTKLDGMAKDIKKPNAVIKDDFNPYRFGMVVKLVVDKYNELPEKLEDYRFEEQVIRLYNQVTEIERKLSASSQEA